MGKENLILEDSFSTHQKIHIFALASPIRSCLVVNKYKDHDQIL